MKELQEFATRVAREAGALLRTAWSEPMEVRHKGMVDLVTSADDASESYEGIRFRVEFLTHVRDRSREFPCARALDHRYPTPIIAKNLVKGPLRAGDEWLHDLRIP